MDARFPERWLNDAKLQRGSPDAYRQYGNALMWSVANRTDGHVPEWALAMIPHASTAVARELTAAGLWAGHEHDGWVIVAFEDTQSSRDELEVLDNARRRQREKKRRQRAASHDVPGDSPEDGTGVRSPGTNEGTALGQDRPGVPRSSEHLSFDNSVAAVSTSEGGSGGQPDSGALARTPAREEPPNGEVDRQSADYWATSAEGPFS